jgi:hypothetical protein
MQQTLQPADDKEQATRFFCAQPAGDCRDTLPDGVVAVFTETTMHLVPDFLDWVYPKKVVLVSNADMGTSMYEHWFVCTSETSEEDKKNMCKHNKSGHAINRTNLIAWFHNNVDDNPELGDGKYQKFLQRAARCELTALLPCPCEC